MFYSAVQPDIPNATYVRMAVRRMDLPFSVYVLAFVYMQGLHDRQTTLGYLTMKALEDIMHRLFVTVCFIGARMIMPTMARRM